MFDACCADPSAPPGRFCGHVEFAAEASTAGRCAAETTLDLDEPEAADSTRSHSLAVDLRTDDAAPVRHPWALGIVLVRFV